MGGGPARKKDHPMEDVTADEVLGGEGGRGRCCKEGCRTAVEDVTSMHVAVHTAIG